MKCENNSSEHPIFPMLSISEGKITDVNKEFSEISGYSRNEIIGKTVTEIFELLKIADDISSEEFDSVGTYLITSGGNVKKVKLIRESNAIKIIEDREWSIRKNFPFLYQQLNNEIVSIAFYSIPNCRLLAANHMYKNIFEEDCGTRRDIVGKKINEFVQNWKDSSTKQLWDECILTGKPGVKRELEHKKFKNGVTYWDKVVTPVLEDGKVRYIISMITDVTEKVLYRENIKKQSEIIKKQGDYLFNIIETFDIPLIRLTYPELRIIEINKKAMKEVESLSLEKNSVYKTGSDDIKKGKSIKDVLDVLDAGYNSEHICKRILEAGTKKKIVNSEKIKIKKDDKELYMKFILQPIINNQGDVNEIIVGGVDISKETEQNAMLQKVLKMQEEFFSFISHEFKTPLTVIMAAVQTMELICKGELSEKALSYIKKIRQSAMQQLRLVNNLLDITRADSGYLRINENNSDIVSMTKAIVNSVLLYANEKGVKIEFRPQIRNKIIGIDDEKYERIILNLLSNAIKFTPKGKSIYVNLYQKENRIFIEIKDEGVGIPKDKQKMIFERFGQVNNSLTRNSEGTGIGLSLVKLLVNFLGGEIKLESEMGKGSTFTVMLPDRQAEVNDAYIQKESVLGDRLIQMTNIEFSNIYFD